MSDTPNFAVVILAAGQGTRMRSDTHKVLHPIAGKALLMHLLDSVDRLGAEKRVVVVGKGRDQVEKALDGRDVIIAHQAEQKGTAHAVQQAKDALAGYDGAVLILYGDTPFVEPETCSKSAITFTPVAVASSPTCRPVSSASPRAICLSCFSMAASMRGCPGSTRPNPLTRLLPPTC